MMNIISKKSLKLKILIENREYQVVLKIQGVLKDYFYSCFSIALTI